MRIITITMLFTLVFSQMAMAENDSINLKSTIKEVTLFMNGAEIKRSSSIALKPGRNILVIRDLSPYADDRNVQISTQPELKILSISGRSGRMKNENFSWKEITAKKDSINAIRDKIALLTNEKTAYEREMQVLDKNDLFASKEKSVDIEALKQAAEFYRIRTNTIKDKVFEINKKIELLNHEIGQTNKRISDITAKKLKPSKELILQVECPASGTFELNFNYFVSNAGWKAVYDIKATEIKDNIKFNYNAKVFNNTGIDWNDVHFVLSTADPTQGASKPTLTPWTLNYASNLSYEGYIQNMYVGDVQNERAYGGSGGYNQPVAGSQTITVSELSAEFDIETKYSIPSNAIPYLIEVSKHELPAAYKHFSIPKVDRDAFLLARIGGWEDLNIIDGEANVYFGNTFIGKSSINTRFVEDTLDLSLGRDKKILVTRSKKQDFSSKKIIGTNQKETYTYEIAVKNNRNVPVSIELIDQVPVSQESDITCDIHDITGAMKDDLSGKLTWKVDLQPGESRKFTISFSVKYPKNKSVKVRKTRAVSGSSLF